MSEALLERHPEDFRRVPIIGSGLVTVGCMDDRPFDTDYNPWNSPEAANVIHDSPWNEDDPSSLQSDIQTAGGMAGIARDVAIALAITNGGELPLGSRTPNVIAQSFTRRARSLGILAVPHQECAADLVAKAAAETTANAANNELLWTAVTEIHPDITEEQFVRGTLAASELVANKQLPSQEEARHIMEADVTRAPLIPEPHNSGDFIADWRQGWGFDTRKARLAGRPAYYANFASASRLVGELGDATPVSESAFLAAMAMRHAALVTTFLEHPAGDASQFNIHRIA